MTSVIANANALHLPFADGIAQCCITSPPYYGLRDYGTAQWEGGSLECDHSYFKGGNGAASAKQVTSSGTQKYQYTDECPKCGARRIDAQIGLESSPAAYVANIVAVMREVRRVLHPSGVAFINLGDSYANNGGAEPEQTKWAIDGASNTQNGGKSRRAPNGLKPKDLIGIPWRVAFALQDDGWYLRSDIIWAKPNPMPESVTDRPTKSHEYVFLLSKRPAYYYDSEAVAEPASGDKMRDGFRGGNGTRYVHDKAFDNHAAAEPGGGTITGNPTRNRRSVWTLATQPYKESHFATMPPKLAELCILAGSSAKGCCPKCRAPWERVLEKVGEVKRRWSTNDTPTRAENLRNDNGRDTQSTYETTGWRPTCSCDAGDPIPCIILDPFSGSGTTGRVAVQHGRSYIGTELNLDYIGLHEQRMTVQTVMEWA